MMTMVFKCPGCGTVWELDRKLEAASKFSKENLGVLIVKGERTCSRCKYTIAADELIKRSYEP